MHFQNLSLRSHLLLALVPGIYLASLEALDLYQIYQLPEALAGLAFPFYFALLGGFVQAPFIAAKSHIALRTCVLIVSALALSFPFSSLVEYMDSHWFSAMYWNYISVAASFSILAILLTTLLCLAAPLRMTLRLMTSVGLAGVVTGVLMLYFADRFLCIMWCDEWQNALLVIPFIIGPLLYSAAVYFGRGNDVPTVRRWRT